jgi:Transposase DNA-binding/Transposase Tn5 dimerisation domain
MPVELDVNRWAQQQFESCELGDVRRTARAIKVAAQFAADPSASTPDQTETWSDCKAVYRLFDEEDVTFTALAAPHWRQTVAAARGHCLLIGDTTIISFGAERGIDGLGIIEGRTYGYLLHSALMVDADSEAIVGLAGQTIHYRRPVPGGETARQSKLRERETKVWGEVVRLAGPPPEGVRFTHVFDRGGDSFEVYCHLLLQRCDWVVRAAQLTRLVRTPPGSQEQLQDYLATLPSLGSYELNVRANHQQTARTARLEVRQGTIALPKPRDCGCFARECGITLITMNVVEVREIDPPSGTTPLRWVLLTSHDVSTFQKAWRVIEYYEKRPLIEEFHKALKTGCRLEERQYRTAKRLEALTALLSVVAARLLQLKSIARVDPERPAEHVVPKRWIQMLSCVCKSPRKPIHTVRDFFRGLAGLGGFLGRKHDGEPGWITLWHGFEKLNLLLRGYDAMHQKCG